MTAEDSHRKVLFFDVGMCSISMSGARFAFLPRPLPSLAPARPRGGGLVRGGGSPSDRPLPRRGRRPLELRVLPAAASSSSLRFRRPQEGPKSRYLLLQRADLKALVVPGTRRVVLPLRVLPPRLLSRRRSLRLRLSPRAFALRADLRARAPRSRQLLFQPPNVALCEHQLLRDLGKPPGQALLLHQDSVKLTGVFFHLLRVLLSFLSAALLQLLNLGLEAGHFCLELERLLQRPLLQLRLRFDETRVLFLQLLVVHLEILLGERESRLLRFNFLAKPGDLPLRPIVLGRDFLDLKDFGVQLFSQSLLELRLKLSKLLDERVRFGAEALPLHILPKKNQLLLVTEQKLRPQPLQLGFLRLRHAVQHGVLLPLQHLQLDLVIGDFGVVLDLRFPRRFPGGGELARCIADGVSEAPQLAALAFLRGETAGDLLRFLFRCAEISEEALDLGLQVQLLSGDAAKLVSDLVPRGVGLLRRLLQLSDPRREGVHLRHLSRLQKLELGAVALGHPLHVRRVLQVDLPLHLDYLLAVHLVQLRPEPFQLPESLLLHLLDGVAFRQAVLVATLLQVLHRTHELHDLLFKSDVLPSNSSVHRSNSDSLAAVRCWLSRRPFSDACSSSCSRLELLQLRLVLEQLLPGLQEIRRCAAVAAVPQRLARLQLGASFASPRLPSPRSLWLKREGNGFMRNTSENNPKANGLTGGLVPAASLLPVAVH
ncbi:hypothetical protein EYF80_042401 [Liparis tanakae]|uniref:Uncharacterized protein n=1 Tax=Liparis tanakae TaxID=230148 RepID=A0A4Z2G1H8_9TELE|nr:hypothetical protein EYF80_042401 [Liparis tanakae]